MALVGLADVKYKVLFIGDSCVGKTSFISRYCDGQFTNTFIATVGIDLKIKRIERNGRWIKLEIWDTAGQERYRAITPAMYNRAEGFVVMFDLTNRQSYYNCQQWVETVMESVDDPMFVLVGNKLDLAEKRAVTFKQAKEFATRRGVEYFECSIKESLGFEEVMEFLVTKLISKTVRKQESIILSNEIEQSNPTEYTSDSNESSTCSKC